MTTDDQNSADPTLLLPMFGWSAEQYSIPNCEEAAAQRTQYG
jgi:hypothetical protein